MNVCMCIGKHTCLCLYLCWYLVSLKSSKNPDAFSPLNRNNKASIELKYRQLMYKVKVSLQFVVRQAVYELNEIGAEERVIKLW